MLMLSDVKTGDWKGFRRVARRYERELKRIRDATAVSADALRRFAAAAVTKKKKAHSR